MTELFKTPSYDEIVDLTNNQIAHDMKLLAQQIDAARIRGEGTSELAQIYQLYEEEWYKRLTLARYGFKSG
jgi:hypothetical protein